MQKRVHTRTQFIFGVVFPFLWPADINKNNKQIKMSEKSEINDETLDILNFGAAKK